MAVRALASLMDAPRLATVAQPDARAAHLPARAGHARHNQVRHCYGLHIQQFNVLCAYDTENV